MNQFKERIKTKKPERRFNKVYEKGKDNQKIYKGSIAPEGELSCIYCVGTVSCFVINDRGEILVEERTANKKISPYALDIVSGHIDNNETSTQAMIREYVEELHSGSEDEKEKARDEAIQNLHKLEELYLVCDGKGYFVQFYCMMTKLEKITRQKEEVESVKWIPMEQLFELIRQGKTGLKYDKKLENIFKQVKAVYQERYEKRNDCGIIRCFR